MEFIKIIQNKRHSISSAIFVVVALYYIKKIIKKSKEFKTLGSKPIPTPKGQYLFLGHIPLFGKKPSFRVTQWHQELGPIFQIKVGVQHWVFIGEPEAAHEIFTTKGSLTSGRPHFRFGSGIHGEGGRGVTFSDYGKHWKNARSAILNILSPKSVDSLQTLLKREADAGVDLLIKDALLSKEGINPLAYTRLTSLNLILAIVFGIQGCRSVQDPMYKEIIENMTDTSRFLNIVNNLGAFFPILSFFDIIFRTERQMRAFVEKKSRPLYHRLVQLARESDQPSLVKKLDEIKESLDIDENNINALSNELTVGGVDTSSIAMAWSLAVLCNHPEWQKKLTDELDLFVQKHNRLPLFNERKETPSLVAVLKETLRYRSSVHFGIPHKASEDVVYKDYVIPKGTVILGNAHTANNDPNFFSEPEKFKPERYLNDTRSLYASSNGNVQSRELFSFGWGRRICPGIYMAENEMFNWLSRLLWKCTIEPIISSTGKKIYPDLNDCEDKSSIVSPVPFKIRLLIRHTEFSIE